MIPFGVSFDGFVPIREAVAVAQKAESLGAQSYWIAEHLGYREAFCTATAIALGTTRGRIYPTAVSPYLRHPTPMAMALASLEELAPGRSGIAVGVGNPLFLKESGLAPEKPLAAVRDYVQGLRGLLKAEPVQMEGATFKLAGAKLAFKTEAEARIFIAAMGPQMLKLSGEIADGALLSAGLSPAYERHQLNLVDEAARAVGRDPARIGKSSYVYFLAASPDGKSRHKIKEKLAFLFRNDKIRENLEFSGLKVDQEAVMAAIAKRDIETAMKLVPDEAIDVLTITGDAAECRRRIDAYLDAGLDEIVLSLVGSAEDRMRSLDLLAALQ